MDKIKKAIPLPEQTGVMVGLFLSSRDQAALRPSDDEVPAGSVREDIMHITLAYYGDSVTQSQKETICNVVEMASTLYGPMEVQVDGVGVFKNDTEDVYYANVVGDQLEYLRSTILRMVESSCGVLVESPNQAFSPHITLFTTPSGVGSTVKVPEMSIAFAQIVCAFGNDHRVFPLAGEAIADAVSEYSSQMQDMQSVQSESSMWTVAKKTAEEEHNKIIEKVVSGSYSRPEGTQYVWVGIATNAYQDKTAPPFNVLPLKSLSDDIERKALAIQQGASEHYGLLDVMHEHQWTIGVCQGRAIVEGTRMEMDWGFIDPEYNDLAVKMLDQEFTMSHETAFFVASGSKKFAIPKTLSSLMMKTRLSNYLWLDTFRFTVAKKGAEANERTYFKIYKIKE